LGQNKKPPGSRNSLKGFRYSDKRINLTRPKKAGGTHLQRRGTANHLEPVARLRKNGQMSSKLELKGGGKKEKNEESLAKRRMDREINRVVIN